MYVPTALEYKYVHVNIMIMIYRASIEIVTPGEERCWLEFLGRGLSSTTPSGISPKRDPNGLLSTTSIYNF
jgi:hypothetical protein